MQVNALTRSRTCNVSHHTEWSLRADRHCGMTYGLQAAQHTCFSKSRYTSPCTQFNTLSPSLARFHQPHSSKQDTKLGQAYCPKAPASPILLCNATRLVCTALRMRSDADADAGAENPARVAQPRGSRPNDTIRQGDSTRAYSKLKRAIQLFADFRSFASTVQYHLASVGHSRWLPQP